MRVILAAAGGGLPGSMTQECRDAVREAACLIGAPRLLADLPEHGAARRVAATRPRASLDAVRTVSEGTCVVLYSGDPGLYSGARPGDTRETGLSAGGISPGGRFRAMRGRLGRQNVCVPPLSAALATAVF